MMTSSQMIFLISGLSSNFDNILYGFRSGRSFLKRICYIIFDMKTSLNGCLIIIDLSEKESTLRHTNQSRTQLECITKIPFDTSVEDVFQCFNQDLSRVMFEVAKCLTFFTRRRLGSVRIKQSEEK
jgi:hypothetical protein